MIDDDFLFPHLMQLFAHYLRDLELTSDQARDRGPFVFVKWLKVTMSAGEAEAEETFDEVDEEFSEELLEDDEPTESQEAIHILRHLVVDDGTEWLAPYWGRMIASFREKPRHPLVEFYGTLVARWKDDYVFPFVCVVPEQFVRPHGSINDQLLLHVSEVFTSQFADLLTSKSSDNLHDIQSGPISRESLRKVFALLTVAVSDLPSEEQPALRRTLRFLRAVSLPALPPDALRSAARNLGPEAVSKTDWRIFPIEDNDEEK